MKRYIRSSSFQPLFRAITVIASVAILATGVTYAALQSQQAVLTGNSISTGTADLKIGTSASNFSNTRAGFTFGNVVPGASESPTDGNSFYLKNFGAPVLSLKIGVTSTPANPANVDLAKVWVNLTRVDSGTTQKFSLGALISGGSSAPLAITDPLTGGAVGQYKVQVSMDSDAFTGQSADIAGIDLVFTGVATAQ